MRVPRSLTRLLPSWRKLHKAVTICLLASLLAGLIPPPLVRSVLPAPASELVESALLQPAAAQAAAAPASEAAAPQAQSGTDDAGVLTTSKTSADPFSAPFDLSITAPSDDLALGADGSQAVMAVQNKGFAMLVTTPVSGIVFLDYNGDGFRSVTSQNPYAITIPGAVNGSATTGLWPVDPGVVGITVTAYISGTTAPVAATTTDASGAYTLNLTADTAYQIIFSGYQEFGYTESAHGKATVTGAGATAQVSPVSYTNNGVTIEPSVSNGFIIASLTAGAAMNSKLHFGLVHTDLYSNVAPRVAWSQGSGGNTALGSGSASRWPLINGWTGSANLSDAMKEVVDRDKVGNVWGLAYQNVSDRLFASSMLRRYSSPLADDPKSDTLYLIDMNRDADPNKNPGAATLISKVSLSALGIDTGDAITRTLNGNDADAFGLVGKRGIGGIAMTTSEYNGTLYFANLTDRKVYGLKVGVPATTTLTSENVVELPAAPWISGDPCNGLGPARPWAVKIHDGNLYVGLVCTGETAPQQLLFVNAGTDADSSGWLSDSGLYTADSAKATTLALSGGGAYETCVLSDQGTVKCWGNNTAGIVGDGTTTQRNSPTTYVPSLGPGVKDISAAGGAACAITAAGAAMCWGEGSQGQLGNGSNTDQLYPVFVTGLSSGVTDIASSRFNTCAVQNGAVKCWGRNTYGQLGNGTTTASNTPVTALASGAVAIDMGDYNTCALMSDNTVRCWGYAGYGGNGNGVTSGNNTTPVTVTLASNSQPLTGAIQITAGPGSACAVMNDSKLMCWGRNNFGQIGDATNSNRSRAVYAKDSTTGNADLTGIIAVDSGDAYSDANDIYGHVCALTNSGTAKCWGRNGNGQLGDNSTTNRSSAVNVSGLSNGVAIGVGAFHSCAVLDDGTVKCWGYNGDGALGDDTIIDRWVATSTQPIFPNTLSYSAPPAPYSSARISQSPLLTYSVPYTNGTYELTAFFYNNYSTTLSVSVEEAVASVTAPTTTQTVHTQNVTISDGTLDVIVTNTGGGLPVAFLNGLALRPVFTGTALVYAHPLADDGSPDTSVGITWTLPISVPLDYDRSTQINGDTCSGLGIGTRKIAAWNGWADSYNDAWHSTVTTTTGCGPVGRRMAAWPQPMLVDIEFSADGKIALGFADRFGYQMKTSGDKNDNNVATDYTAQPHPPGSADTSGTGYYSADYAGDLLCASGTGIANGAWTLEPGGLCSGGGATTNVGTASEFFADKFTDKRSINRWEPVRGALYTIPGSQSVAVNTSYLATTYDYIDGATTYGWNSGASLRTQPALFANTADNEMAGFGFAGNNLHNYELLSAPAPVEIGDYVWYDDNGNGSQDPGEPGLAGVVVKLTDVNGNVAQATTDAAGYFLFSSDGDPTPTDVRKNGSASRIYGLDGGSAGEVNLLPIAASPFILTIALNQNPLKVGAEQMYPTIDNVNTANPPSGPGAVDNDPRDNDGLYAVINDVDTSAIQFYVGTPGSNDSAYDFGFTLPALTVGNKIWADANNNGQLDSGENGLDNVAVELYVDSNNDLVFTPGTDKWLMNTTTNGSGDYLFTKAPPGNLLVVITSTNFSVGGALSDMLPSQPLNFAAADGNSNRDTVSHGRRYGLLGSGGYVAATVMTLAGRREPDTVLDGDDTYGNLTLDFGFINATVCGAGSGDVGGAIFIDNDFNGLMGNNETLLPISVTVTAYDAQNSVIDSAMVGPDGRYVLSGLYSGRSPSETLRFEFTNLPDGYGTGPDGSYSVAAGGAIVGSGSSIQFRSAASCDVNYGVSDLYASSCANAYLGQCVMYGGSYSNGNPLVAGSNAATGDNVVSWRYGATGYRSGDYLAEAKGANVGAVWGMASNKPQGQLMVSAMLKRTVGLGPLGLGGIYRMTPRGSDAPEQFINLTDLGIELGAANVPSNAVRSADHDDPLVVAQWVAKAGIGDIELDEKGQTLWVTNLYERKLVAINVLGKSAIGGANPVTVTDILTQTAIPMPTCVGGEGRPWGIAAKDDSLYAGVVCDAYTSQNRHDLKAAIYRFDITTSQWDATAVVEFPLDYRLPNLNPGSNVSFTAEKDSSDLYFQPWQDMAPNIRSYRQPLVADIEFDDDGGMIVQVIDRSGHQRTPYQRNPIPSFYTTGGDTLRFCLVDDAYVAQGEVGCPNMRNNGNGLNGGQYYWGVYANPYHFNTQNAGLAVIEGTRQVVVGMMDPNDQIFSQGVTYLSSLTGERKGGYILTSSFGKGIGIGDVEILCDPAPLEIGNRIWVDSTRDGIQDAAETPLAGITVKLYRSGPDEQWATTDDVLVATTTTNSRGEYIFKDSTDGNADRDIYAQTEYQVRVDTTQSALLLYQLTMPNVAAGSGKANAVNLMGNEPTANNYADLRDSDATLVGADAVVQLTTGLYRDNNHTYDIGFYLPPVSIGNRVWYDTDNDGSVTSGEQNVADGVVVELYQDSDSSGGFSAGDTRVASTVTSGGYYTFTNLTPSSSDATRYLVVITDTNFLAGGLLYGYHSSDGQITDNSSAADNNKNHGAVSGTLGQAGGVVASSVISLTVGTQPTGEANEGNDPIQSATDADSNQTIDFGFYSLSVGNRVWLDDGGGTSANADNGQLDSGESGLDGVTVELLDSGNAVVSTTTTSNGGYYTFTGLISGAYSVRISGYPANYRSSSDTVNASAPTSADDDDNGPGTAMGTLTSQPFILVPGSSANGHSADNATGVTSNPRIDFGLYAAPAGFALDKRLVSPASGVAAIGDSVVYDLVITNTGGITLTSITLVDSYDADYLHYSSASVNPTAQASGVLTWTVTSPTAPLPLSAGEVMTVTVTFTAAKP